MKVDAPPLNGNARQKLAWMTGIVLTGIIVVLAAGGAMVLDHEARISVVERQVALQQKSLERIENKIDRLLSRAP